MSAPTQFRKKPVVISAIQWTGENLVDVIHFTDGRPPNNKSSHAGMMWDQYVDLVRKDGLKIFTMEGKMDASIGDWIIKGVKGEHYPCKPEIFALTYEDASAGTDLSQAAVAAALEAAAQTVDTLGDSAVTEALGARLCCDGHLCGCQGADVGEYILHHIRALITPAQHDALAAHVAAEVAKARAEDAAKIEVLVDTVKRMNAACDAMWNDHERLEKNAGYFAGQQPWQLKDAHMRAISEAQQDSCIILAQIGAKP